ncbi:MAG: ABC transporter substrate-binding protein [Coriobacteriia bacterium]|jgi:NitT/TauT family transport system substrate-binding protein|nr:ABC transporter substrate-binding protein [Coriobacteriia bacterium]
MNRRKLYAVSVLALLALAMLGACAPRSKTAETTPDAALAVPQPAPVTIGVLPTEDVLPLWVAQERALYAENGIDSVSIVVFETSEERDAALAVGEVDACMSDIVAAAQLEAAGTPVTIANVALGAEAAEGRFGVVGAIDSGYVDITALVGAPVSTSVNSLEEYVVDGLMRQADVSAADVVAQDGPGAAARYEQLLHGQLKAAVLPEPWLTRAEAEGAPVLADDTTGENLSQTTLIFSDEYLCETGGVDTMSAILKTWDDAVAIINGDPDEWRDLLAQSTRIPDSIKDTYRMNTYPMAQIPSAAQIDAVLEWLADKGAIGRGALTYEDLVLVMP